ncbi:hypothetical protein V6Z12_D07G013600 [Gossypium hirsutum]
MEGLLQAGSLYFYYKEIKRWCNACWFCVMGKSKGQYVLLNAQFRFAFSLVGRKAFIL